MDGGNILYKRKGGLLPPGESLLENKYVAVLEKQINLEENFKVEAYRDPESLSGYGIKAQLASEGVYLLYLLKLQEATQYND